MSSRFPFPSFPRGWYVVAFSSDVAAGEVKTLHYFGQDIVVFRTQSGVVSAVDKTCPHLGAHLGGGRVDGECLRCPFHAWAFDATGQCTSIPYASKIPAKASLRTWPLHEHNGAIFVFYDPSGQPPTWELEALPEEGWTPNRCIRWEINSHPQEIAENTVDCAHLLPVHGATGATVISLEQRDHFMRVVLNFAASGAVIQMPDEINDVELDVTLHGLGQLISNTHVLTAGMRTRQRIHPTPIDGGRVAIFALGNTREMSDPEYTREIDEIFWNAFVTDFAKDFPIWENKAYLERPLLASGDGPIGKYRRWARQFYGEPQLAGPATTATMGGTAPALRGGAWGGTAPALRGGAWGGTAPALRGGAWGGTADRVRPLGALGAWLERAKSVLARRPDHGEPAADTGTSQVERAGERNGDGNTNARGAVPAQARFASIDAYFGELERRFDPSAAGDLVAVYQWLLTGDAPRAHFAEIEHGRIRAAAGTHAAPTVTIEMSAADYLLMINGELNGALAFSTGRGRLRGPVRLAMKMKGLFPLERVL